MQFFGEARDSLGRSLYRVTLATIDGGAVTTTLGAGVIPHDDASALRRADMVVIPGTHHRGAREVGRLDEDLLRAIASVPCGARVVSICTGAFVLGAAGVLDGRTATTHWSALESLRSLYPHVDVTRALYTEHANVLTSAGLSAGIDLCLHIIRDDHGADAANRVARFAAVQGWRSADQLQFAETPLPESGIPSTAAAREWALENLHETITVASLAGMSNQSSRTFARRFREETGTTPHAWLTQQRVRQAQRMLETTSLGIDEIAQGAGFGSSAALRASFRATVGVPPAQYRRRYAGPADRR